MTDMEQKLTYHMDKKLKEAHYRLELYITKLEGLSPLLKLKKGYALVRGKDNLPIQSIKSVTKNDLLTVSLLDGDIISKVEDIKEAEREKL